MDTKVCNKCGKELPLTSEYFFKNKNLKDGFEYACKECRGYKVGIYQINVLYEPKEGHKFCSKCHKELPATTHYFFQDKNSMFGISSICKKCKGHSYGEHLNFSKIVDNKKTCSKCNRLFPLTDEYFNKCNKVKSGYNSSCKECNGSSFGIHQINKVKKSKKGYKYCSLCKQELQLFEFYKTNNSYHDRCKKCDLLYRQTESGRMSKKISWQKRRALKKQLPSTLTKEQWGQIKQYFNNTCCYCGKKLERATMEHFIPLSLGGGLTKENILPCCTSCNSSKGNRNFFEWYQSRKFYCKERKKKILEYLNIKEHKSA